MSDAQSTAVEIREAIGKLWKHGMPPTSSTFGLAIVDWLEHEADTAETVDPALHEQAFAHALAVARAVAGV